MVQKARTISLGDVVQVDNAILQRLVETGTTKTLRLHLEDLRYL